MTNDPAAVNGLPIRSEFMRVLGDWATALGWWEIRLKTLTNEFEVPNASLSHARYQLEVEVVPSADAEAVERCLVWLSRVDAEWCVIGHTPIPL